MRHQTLSKNHPVRFLALGDSYTVGESVAEDQRWPVQLVQALMERGYQCHPPKIIATTGWRTDDLKNALDVQNLSNEYNLVSLLIGVNNQYQGRGTAEYEKEFEQLLDKAIHYANPDHSVVMVLSIPDYGYTPSGRDRQPEISSEIDAFNAINQSISKKKGVKYINVTDISRQGFNDPALIAEDGLHPSEKMYALWTEKILQDIAM